MLKRVHFRPSMLPYLLVAPQIVITLVFFIWPAAQALYQSLLSQDAFGLSTKFVWFANFRALLSDPLYFGAFKRTFMFSFLVAGLSMGLALLFAAMADRVIKARLAYQTLLIWPYAVAPAVAGALWMFLFDPTLGIGTYFLHGFGIDWKFRLNGSQAMAVWSSQRPGSRSAPTFYSSWRACTPSPDRSSRRQPSMVQDLRDGS